MYWRFLILILLTSCTGQGSFVSARLETAEQFVDCLKKNTPDKILDYSYPNVDHKIRDKESRDFYVNKAYQFIKKFGLPPREKWLVKYDPHNNFERLVITIPIFKGFDSTFNLLRADIVLVFPPPQISDKIYHYDIDDAYKISRIDPPAAIDTLTRSK